MNDDYAVARAGAKRLIREYGIKKPSDIDVEAVAYDLGLYVKYGPLGGSAARLVCKSNKGIIRVSDSINIVGQQRFCIAHEIGHYLLHAGKNQECSFRDMVPAYFGSDPELEANAFAGELLLPKEMYRGEWQGKELSLDSIERTAEQFQSTITATAFRHVELGIHVCSLAMAVKGRLQWFQVGPDFPYRIIESGTRLDATSCAGEFFLSNKREKTEEEVPATTWLEDERIESSWTIKEICIPMPTFESALSLLWIVPGSEMDIGYF